MKKKRVCFIAQFPPPIHGLSKAVDTLYRSDLNEVFDFDKIDITRNRDFVKNLFLIWNSKADIFYFTISQTKAGNIRDLIILNLLKFRKKKCLVHLHGGYYRHLIDKELSGWQRRININVIKNLSGVIVLGPSLKFNFQGIINEEKIHIVPNCIDDEYLISEAEFEKKNVALEQKEVLNVLYLSNFIRSKGYPEVLKMAKLEKERVSEGGTKQFHFNFAGKFFEVSEREFFEDYIKENELQDFISYHGVVTGQQKKELLNKCDIFILLTRYPNEGQPISILEAMGNGMVIVTTDHAGIPDIVKDGINGIVVREEIDINKTFEALLMRRSQLHLIGRVNRTTCLLNYKEKSYIKNLENIFKEES
ncbi:glycosyltransferase family 4 protein [Paenibacillus sp. JDR-2]|uniref:glycosyltransferase family 4 protein n=1 Tax=Paenibacillus sp. (strain JDR-2) TaxID=324057 RepID=UPI000166AFA0|nr:glycosyltransferase family 4 protein [Paenibacillus sp. JDR-2]ACS99087.1 glycosyl transferase group 1 [Paenibacillus sp. JDR-2]